MVANDYYSGGAQDEPYDAVVVAYDDDGYSAVASVADSDGAGTRSEWPFGRQLARRCVVKSLHPYCY